VDRRIADYAGHGALAHEDLLGEEHTIIDAAHAIKGEGAIGVDARHDEPDLVHVGGHHHRNAAARAAFERDHVA